MKKTLSLAKRNYQLALVHCISDLKTINESILNKIGDYKHSRKDLNSAVMALTRNNLIISHLEKELE